MTWAGDGSRRPRLIPFRGALSGNVGSIARAIAAFVRPQPRKEGRGLHGENGGSRRAERGQTSTVGRIRRRCRGYRTAFSLIPIADFSTGIDVFLTPSPPMNDLPLAGRLPSEVGGPEGKEAFLLVGVAPTRRPARQGEESCHAKRRAGTASSSCFPQFLPSSAGASGHTRLSTPSSGSPPRQIRTRGHAPRSKALPCASGPPRRSRKKTAIVIPRPGSGSSARSTPR